MSRAVGEVMMGEVMSEWNQMMCVALALGAFAAPNNAKTKQISIGGWRASFARALQVEIYNSDIGIEVLTWASRYLVALAATMVTVSNAQKVRYHKLCAVR
ncbi:16559_t:CDS:2 [Acaulospora colombiana]|uniref:16559_t:CDS:1 n=1 Tax=Acaulospora colombiana TaxID=27376 RepID=A0ACA9PNK2_9GLOM|nr:16559_t:CDS:2 [Acaulospora colombiana]